MEISLEKQFALRLRKAREATGLTQGEVAERAGLAVEAYGRLERGSVLPRASTLLALARTLSTSADNLLGNELGEKAPLQPADERDPADIRRLIRRLRTLDKRAVRVVSVVAAELAKRKVPKRKSGG